MVPCRTGRSLAVGRRQDRVEVVEEAARLLADEVVRAVAVGRAPRFGAVGQQHALAGAVGRRRRYPASS